jgi:hypothetical protein
MNAYLGRVTQEFVQDQLNRMRRRQQDETEEKEAEETISQFFFIVG